MNQDLFRPTYLKQLCEQYQLTPSKKYGQNYLISDAPINKMIAAADVKPGDTVIEIGPGFGVLTHALADTGAQVTAFEIERKLEDYWHEQQLGNVEIVWGDALKEIRNRKSEIGDYKVVANLPYQITSNILRTLLELENKPQSITVMVQKEVADRIVAQPGDMSLLSVSVQYFGESKVVTKVAAGSFWPAPKVDSAVVSIQVHGKREKEFDKKFFEVVRAGFSNKRKQVWSNLSKGLNLDKDRVKVVLQEVAGNEKIRAQEISVEQWISITSKLT